MVPKSQSIVTESIYRSNAGLLCAQSLSRIQLCDPMDYSLPDSSVPGIFQARILGSAAILFSRGSFWPRNQILVSCIAGQLPAHLPNTRQLRPATPAWSSAWYSPAKPGDTCLLIYLLLASWALRNLPAHLPDNRQLSRATPASSSVW